MRTWHWRALVALLFALFVGVRFYGVGLDPPRSMPNHGDQHELLQEPPAKAHEARDFALFGSFAPDPNDQYRYWLAQSPAWVVPLGYTLRAFGVSYFVLRAFSIAGAALGFLALVALARERLGAAGALAAAVFLGFNYYWIQYTRYGLLEPNLCGWLTLAALGVHRARRRPGWLVVAILAFAAALLTKQTALFALPALGVAGLFAARRASPRWRVALAAIAIASAAAFAAYASQPAYARALARNFVHASENREGGGVDLGAMHLGDVLARAVSLDRWGIYYLSMFTVAGVLALAQLARVARDVALRRADPWDALVAAWAGSAFAALAWSPLAQNRFFLILFPPVTLLAGRAIDAWVRHVRAPAARVALPAIAIVNHLVLAAAPLSDWLGKAERDVDRARARVERAVLRTSRAHRPPVVVGLLAAPLLFETPFRQRYVKNEFNAERDVLAALGPTHALLVRDGDITEVTLRKAFPGMLAELAPVESLRFEAAALDLYALPDLAKLRPPKRR